MPKEFEDCVIALKKQGKSDNAAYAICVAKYKDAHNGKSPFTNEEIDQLSISKDVKLVLKGIVEAEKKGKKLTYIKNDRTA